jgi:hypothetical protein
METDGSLIPLYSVFIGLAVVAVVLRIVARILTRAYFWWDDFANLFAFVCSHLQLPKGLHTDRSSSALHC